MGWPPVVGGEEELAGEVNASDEPRRLCVATGTGSSGFEYGPSASPVILLPSLDDPDVASTAAS